MQPLRPLDFSDDAEDDVPEVWERSQLLDKVYARLLRRSTDELRVIAESLPDYLEVMQASDKLVQLVKTNITQVGSAASDDLRSELVRAMNSLEFVTGRVLKRQMGIGDELGNWLSFLKNKADARIGKVDHTTQRYTSHVNRNGDSFAGWDGRYDTASGVIPPQGVVSDVVGSSFYSQPGGARYPIDPNLIGYASYVQGNVPAEVGTVTGGVGTGAIATSSSMRDLLLDAQQQADLASLENDVNGPAPGEFEDLEWADSDLIDEDFPDD